MNESSDPAQPFHGGADHPFRVFPVYLDHPRVVARPIDTKILEGINLLVPSTDRVAAVEKITPQADDSHETDRPRGFDQHLASVHDRFFLVVAGRHDINPYARESPFQGSPGAGSRPRGPAPRKSRSGP